ncbi:hypothetical protein DOY81_010639 [Sarcophaga bullata]|nr:hypothetical protein DOY81_010639 [Sarcophaga bullata]
MRLQLLGNEIALAILLLLKIYKNCVTAERICHACHGINCLRTSYNVTQNCVDDFDICVTVFEGQTVVYQGCLEQLSEELRNKCNTGLQVIDKQNSSKLPECFKCNGNLCNNLASETFNCIQCDSSSDINCDSKPESLVASRCLLSRTPNEYCFTKREGERIVRGCLQTLEQQTACLSSEDCMICQPSEMSDCNNMGLSIDGGVNGSEGSEGDGSENAGDNGNGSNNSGSGSSEPGGDGAGNNSSENGSTGSNNEGNANDNSGGGNSESGVGSGNGGPSSGSEGSAPDGSGNSSFTNSSSGSNNGVSGSEGTTSNDGSNGSSVTISPIFGYLQYS